MFKKNKIAVAKHSEINEIMNYINSYWKRGHILARNKIFFLFQHGNGKKLNYIISKNEKNKINGIIGFINPCKKKKLDVWTTLWLVKKNSIDPMLGINLLQFVKKIGFRSISSIGIGYDTIDIYKYLGFTVDKLNHFFYPNDKILNKEISIFPKKIKRFFISKINNKYNISKITAEELRRKFTFSNYKSRIPFKNWEYFNKRYFLHPIFKYQVFGIFLKKKLISILVMREVHIKSSSALRVIDYYGEESPFKYLYNFFKELINTNNYEYIDLLCHGMNKKIIESAGFIEIPLKSKKIIIPNYFDPFIKKNIPIYFYIDKKLDSHVRFFKGDADQDRPN